MSTVLILRDQNYNHRAFSAETVTAVQKNGVYEPLYLFKIICVIIWFFSQ
jgi:hypothetical protein